MPQKSNKGFTLIELLVVIAIIAILSIVVILTLNPAELLRQARDSNRISDMATLKSAISLYLADVGVPILASTSVGNTFYCYVDNTAANTSATCPWFTTGAPCVTPGVANMVYTTAANQRAVNGAGWIPVNFNAISSGAPIGQLPVDPLDNDKLHYYSYHGSSTLTFKIAAKMESVKYSYGTGGTNDIESTDGGCYPSIYETGTNLTNL